MENRRKFFENYAAENGFDPRDPEKWYSEPIPKIKAVRVIFLNTHFIDMFY